ncbi:hypothetical protein BX600DRAFT_507944 [Xylariales sp. PMI_506]|nr:hypothetical protein BX600DRAFT_507944 [Xylariales sp. PMI_506]
MLKPRDALRGWLLAAILGVSNAAYISPASIFERTSTCGDSSYSPCAQAGLPDNFCCPSGNSCIPLAGNTTILCCPDNQSCDTIAPIVCNVQLQNATAYPDAAIKTTALTSELSACGSSSCCPFGYTCNADNNCVISQDQSEAPGASSGDTTTSPSQTSTPASSTIQVSSATSTTTAASDSSAGATTTTTGARTSAIVGGVVGGIGGIACIAALVFVCRRRRSRKKAELKRQNSDESFFSKGPPPPISGPYPHTRFPHERTDFAAMANSRSSGGSSSPTLHLPHPLGKQSSDTADPFDDKTFLAAGPWGSPSTTTKASDDGKNRNKNSNNNNNTRLETMTYSPPFNSPMSSDFSHDDDDDDNGGGGGYARRRSHHDSAMVPGLGAGGDLHRGLRGTPPQGRKPSADDEHGFLDVPLCADPLTVPQIDHRRDTTMTQWTSIMNRAANR